MTLNDEVSRHATSDYKHFHKTQNSTENHTHNKNKMEVINNKSQQKESRKTETQHTAQPGQPTKEAFILHQVFNKTDRPPDPQMARLAPIMFAWDRTGLGKA